MSDEALGSLRAVPGSSAGGAPEVNPAVYRLVVGVTYLPVLLQGGHLEVHGHEYVPPPGQALIVAGNHRSALDPFLIARALPGHHLQFIAKKELFVPVLGPIIRAGGSFPVDRDAHDVGAVRTSLKILGRGGTVGIFPEGTRGGGEIHGGVAIMAFRGRAPVLPVGLRRSGTRWVVRFGPVLEPVGQVRELTARLGQELGRLAAPYGRPCSDLPTYGSPEVASGAV
ncbi:lysophospholipid acyltransferase family protein [Deinococcus lacus]|uniref:Lysophospholipid acyltransferase family protein n=1 Tax=Deinococcus lacus TaxID=392561 RepID=A0ABW1YCG2_9DEIO